jgi:hypothetical protein
MCIHTYIATLTKNFVFPPHKETNKGRYKQPNIGILVPPAFESLKLALPLSLFPSKNGIMDTL